MPGVDLDALAWETTEQLGDIAAADARIDRATAQAQRLWAAAWGRDELLCSVPGIGPMIAPIVRAWFGDATQFTTGKQAAAFVGLNPSNWESGLMAAPSRPITKEGRPSCGWRCITPPTSPVVAIRSSRCATSG